MLAVGCASRADIGDPCRLLTSDDIAAAQGAAPTSAQATLHDSGNIHVSQCIYLLPEQSRSVTLEVTTAPHVHELWEKQFEPGEEREREHESNETHAIEVKGLGRDAFWGGNRVSGALYVEMRNAIMRISIGGPGDTKTKMDRAKELAKLVLLRAKS